MELANAKGAAQRANAAEKRMMLIGIFIRIVESSNRSSARMDKDRAAELLNYQSCLAWKKIVVEAECEAVLEVIDGERRERNTKNVCTAKQNGMRRGREGEDSGGDVRILNRAMK